MTSRDVVNVVQHRLPKKVKVGHAGTLDPLAEGVLVLGVGPAVRLVPYVQQQPKHYRATFRLGVSTVSGDLEGELTQHPDLPIPTRQQIDAAAAGLVGRIEQTPPAHSAIWVDGQRAYKRIRAGEEFEMPKRTVDIESLNILRYEYPEIEFDTVCGSGTYIRTLGLDLALAAGSTAVMSHLCRRGVGVFAYADAVSIDQLREDDLQSMLIAPSAGVEHLPHLIIDPQDSERLGHGLCIDGEPVESKANDHRREGNSPESSWIHGAEAAAVNRNGELRAILRRKNDAWCPYRVFPAL
jgi:tRNA pseudouridine55 synthase